MLGEFRNEPLRNFALPEDRGRMEEALRAIEGRLGRRHPLRIGGAEVETGRWIRSVNPSDPDQVIAEVARAGQPEAERAIAAAEEAFPRWSRRRHAERARYLFKAAAIMRRRRDELAAWMVLEAGKTWGEADADVAEAIDFLEFYGREAARLEEPHPLVRIPGEDNELFYIPLGVGVCIPPWNFPLAILTGITSSAAVAGNTVILKPASTTPAIAAQFMAVMEEAGIPPGVINFCPGSGDEIGDFLAGHPRVRFISFTGSRDVGLRINELAARRHPEQRWIKRVVAEMGGKDAIVVDETADLEDAARGIVASAFGFQGQKCSAASRAILVDSIYERVLGRVEELTRQLRVGPARDPETQVGPVIDEAAREKIEGYIAIGRSEGRLVCGGGRGAGKGYFIQPTIFADVDPRARIAQEEIFGPVLACIRARDFDHALAIANDTVYGLTGSLYSRDRERLERARLEFHVGNLYFNRKSTGALVGVHPFGGFNLSGTDSKAGGRDYLLLFLQAKAVSEKL